MNVANRDGDGDGSEANPNPNLDLTVSVTLFPFRYRDPLTSCWIKARYKATRDEIAARYTEWEITGPAEVREPVGGAFRPYRVAPHAELRREPPPQHNPHLERPPAIDAGECFLVALFLRRYVTYYARRGRFAQMQAAAHLHREVTMAFDALA